MDPSGGILTTPSFRRSFRGEFQHSRTQLYGYIYIIWYIKPIFKKLLENRLEVIH